MIWFLFLLISVVTARQLPFNSGTLSQLPSVQGMLRSFPATDSLPVFGGGVLSRNNTLPSLPKLERVVGGVTSITHDTLSQAREVMSDITGSCPRLSDKYPDLAGGDGTSSSILSGSNLITSASINIEGISACSDELVDVPCVESDSYIPQEGDPTFIKYYPCSGDYYVHSSFRQGKVAMIGYKANFADGAKAVAIESVDTNTMAGVPKYQPLEYQSFNACPGDDAKVCKEIETQGTVCAVAEVSNDPQICNLLKSVTDPDNCMNDEYQLVARSTCHDFSTQILNNILDLNDRLYAFACTDVNMLPKQLTIHAGITRNKLINKYLGKC